MIKRILAIFSFALLSVLFYGNTFNHEFSLDDNYILKILPEKANSLEDCFEVFNKPFDQTDYRPIPVFTFALEKFLNNNDLNPGISHKVNVFIFFLGACILFFTIMQLKIPESELIALIATLIFIAHPIHSNVVSSLKNRDILLSFMFSISSVLCFIKFIYTDKNAFKFIYILLSVILFFLATISKIDSIWVVFAAPLLVINSGKKLFDKKFIIRVILVGLVFLLIATAIRSLFISEMVELEEMKDVEAILFTENPIIDAGFFGKIYYVICTIYYQLKFLLVPFGYYFYFGHKMIGPPHIFQPYFLMGLILTIVIIWHVVKNLKKDDPKTIAWLFMGITALYCTNILRPIAGIVDPRLLFQTSAGFCLLIAWFIYTVAKNETLRSWVGNKITSKSPNALAYFVTILIILFYFPFTYSRNADWKNIYTLMDADIPHLKNSFQANRIASYHYLNSAKNQRTQFDRNQFLNNGLFTAINAIKIDPDRINVQEGKGIALNLLGIQDSAKRQFKYIIEKFDTSEVAWDMLGDIYFNTNKPDSASWCYKNTIRVSEDYEQVYYKYTSSMIKSGKIDSVQKYYENMLETNEEWYVPYDNLSYIHINKGDTLTSGIYYIKGYKYGLRDKNLLKMFYNYFERKGYEIELRSIKYILSTL